MVRLPPTYSSSQHELCPYLSSLNACSITEGGFVVGFQDHVHVYLSVGESCDLTSGHMDTGQFNFVGTFFFIYFINLAYKRYILI